MAWQETKAIEQRMKFVNEVESRHGSFSEVCARYGVSRVTGYKWRERYEQEGAAGLWERSRAPHRVEHALSDELRVLVLAGRRTHRTWGPRKLLAWLKAKHPQRRHWCVASTIGELLKLEGLSVPRLYRRQSVPRIGALEPYDRPTQVWCMDFKGWFHLGNGQRCEPWTLSDGCSRYLLGVQALLHAELQSVWRGCEVAFREFGLPEVIRNDNGRPFAGLGLGGLSRLAVWWLKLGIRPERIRPGQPQENGRHERMHLTLKEVIEPPAKTLSGQQRRFREFRQEFNEERPHEALGQKTPASVYRVSPRPYPRRLPEVQYESGIVIKRVYQHGDITWRGQRLFLSEALGGEDVGFEPLAREGLWLVRFGGMKLAKFDERKRQLQELSAEEVKP
jgi:transposase InsO family protein